MWPPSTLARAGIQGSNQSFSVDPTPACPSGLSTVRVWDHTSMANKNDSSGQKEKVTVAKFGWLSPVAGHAGSDFQPIVMYQQEHIFPSVLAHFDSVWIADHFYGFDERKEEGFLEAWTTLTWIAARFT